MSDTKVLKASNLSEFDQNLHRYLIPNKDHVVLKRLNIKKKNGIVVPENKEAPISFGIIVAKSDTLEHLEIGQIVYNNYVRGTAYPMRDIVKGDTDYRYFQTNVQNILGFINEGFEFDIEFDER